MTMPTFQEMFLPFLAYIADGNIHTKNDVSDHLAVKFNLTPDELAEILPSGKQTKFMNRIAWTRTYFGKALLVESTGRGLFKITQRGIDGEELANLMLEFNVGVSPTTTYSVKKLDMDYFEES